MGEGDNTMRIILVLVLIVGFATTAPKAEAQSDAIQSTITAQLEAFKLDDFAEAFTFASPMIQNIFRSADNFGQMVRGGYPMVWRPGDVTYLELEDRDGQLYQKVLIKDGDGALHLLEYQMIELAEGWRINGVRLLDNPPASV